MYNSNNVAQNIKFLTKSKNIPIGEMLVECELSKNAISSMLLGSMPKADNLAKIADYLGCSVDYLLGRSDNPDNPNLKIKDYTKCLI